MSKLKILYVDDEVINLMLFEANLEKEFDVVTALDGLKGLQKINEIEDIKVIFSDMKMPRMNGIEFLKQAKSKIPDVPCFIITGFEITDEIQHALDNKLIVKYLKKPFNMRKITEEIHAVINN